MALPKETHGKFFNGDAYIIYCCSEYGEAGGSDVKPRRNESTKLEQHIHFWIGEKASQDEATVAAYKTVELDDLLSGAPIQHREVQGHESHRFKSYFKNGMRIMVRKHSVTLFENYSKCRIWILAFFTNFCPIKTDLSGNTVWPQALGFQKLAKLTTFGIFY